MVSGQDTEIRDRVSLKRRQESFVKVLFDNDIQEARKLRKKICLVQRNIKEKMKNNNNKSKLKQVKERTIKKKQNVKTETDDIYLTSSINI